MGRGSWKHQHLQKWLRDEACHSHSISSHCLEDYICQNKSCKALGAQANEKKGKQQHMFVFLAMNYGGATCRLCFVAFWDFGLWQHKHASFIESRGIL